MAPLACPRRLRRNRQNKGQVENPPARKVNTAHVFSWEHWMKDCRIPPYEAQGHQGPQCGPGLHLGSKGPASPREPGSKAEPGRQWPAPANMVARPGLPDKRGTGTLFRLAGRPDSDNDRRVLSLKTCLALQIVRLETKPNWRLRGEGAKWFCRYSMTHQSCLLGLQIFGKRCHSIFKACRQGTGVPMCKQRRTWAPDLQ